MGAIVFGLGKRLWSSLVLVSFVWMTLLPTLVFAEFERAAPDPVSLETHKNIRYAHFNVGVKKYERPPSPISIADTGLDGTMTQRPAPSELILPIGETHAETEMLIDETNTTLNGIKPTITECALTWTEFGLNLFRHNSGDLIISKNEEFAHLFDPSIPLQIDNRHGSIILDDNLEFDLLVLCGKDVVLKGDVSVKNLSLFIESTILNRAFLSVSTLYMDGIHQRPDALLTHPKFINEGHLVGPSDITGNALFYNAETGHVEQGMVRLSDDPDVTVQKVTSELSKNPSQPTTFSLDKPIVNDGVMAFNEAVVVNHQTLINHHTFKSTGAIRGALNGLDNSGTVQADGGFDLTIDHFHNAQKGLIQGTGQLTVNTAVEREAINNGETDLTRLALQIEGTFSNNHLLQTHEILEIRGKGTFRQKGTLRSPKVILNNAHVESEQALDQPQLELMCGEEVKTFTNHKDVSLNLKTLQFAPSTASDANALNQGTIRTDLFDNGAATFTNHEIITADHWHQTGKTFANKAGATMDVFQAATVATDRITNAGDINIQKNITGSVTHFSNTGGFTIQGDAVLTGATLSNAKTLRAHHLLDWHGQSFTTAPSSHIHTQILNVKITDPDPLTFEGTVTNDHGATINAPSVINKATFKTETGSTTIARAKALDNQASFTVDTLLYEGKALSNTTAHSTFNANRFHRAIKLDTLLNEGSFVIETGGFAATKITNKKTLELKRGLYQCDTLENTGGTATIDQLSLTGLSPILDGTVTVDRFIPAHDRYTQITINGTTTLNSGDFHTGTLTLKGTLTLGKGQYQIDRLVGDQNAKLLLQPGAHVTIDGIAYEGAITSSVNLTLDLYAASKKPPSLVETLCDVSDQRRHLFNTPSNDSPESRALKTKTIQGHTTHVEDILSDQRNVSLTRRATLNEKKTLLQIVMANEITKTGPCAQANPYLYAQPRFTALDANNPLFAHFEVLRLTEKYAHLLMRRVVSYGYSHDSLRTYFNTLTHTAEYKTLFAYSDDLSEDLFFSWFEAILQEHTLPGLPTRSPSANGYAYPFSLLPAAILRDTAASRKVAYNAHPSFVSPKRSSLNRDTLYHYTTTITDILRDPNKVSQTRKASESEKKIALQALMGSVLTAHIHSEDHQKKLTLTTNLPKLAPTDTLFQHFEILRLSEKLTHRLLEHITENGADEFDAGISEEDADFALLKEYSDLDHTLFLSWFKDVFNDHKTAFLNAIGSSLSFIPKPESVFADISTFKSLTSKKDLILSSTRAPTDHDWISAFLYANQLNWRTDRFSFAGKFIINAPSFANTHRLRLPFHVYFNTQHFTPKNTLTVRGMNLRASDAQIGSDNNNMVKVTSYGKMDAIVEGDVDVRFGLLQSTDFGRVKSKHGKILIGARKDVSDQRVEKNGAMITSTDEELILEAPEDGIYNHFGVAKGKKLLHYKTKKLENISADGISDGAMVLDVDELSHLILDEIYHYNTNQFVFKAGTLMRYFGMVIPNGTTDTTYEQSVKADSSILRARGNITINSRNAPKIFGSGFESYGSILWRHASGALIDVPGGNVTSAFLVAANLAEIRSLEFGYCRAKLHDDPRFRLGFPYSGMASYGKEYINPTFTAAVNIDFDFSGLNLLFEGAATGQQIVVQANGMQLVNAAGVRQPNRNAPVLFNVAASANRYINTPLIHRETRGTTTYYTQNLPGVRNVTPNIAVFNRAHPNHSNAVPRALFPRGEASSTDRFNPIQYKNVFDYVTLENAFMTFQQVYTGGFHPKGPEFLTWIIQNGHAFNTATQGLTIEEALEQAQKPMIGYIPQETPEGTIIYDLMGFFTKDMHTPYAGTSGNIQATGTPVSDRVEELSDGEPPIIQKKTPSVQLRLGQGGLHESGATIGGGQGDVLIKTEDGGHNTICSQTQRTYTGNGYRDSIAVSNLTESSGSITRHSDGVLILDGDVTHEAGKGTADPTKKLTLSGKQGLYGVETTLNEQSVSHVSKGKVKGTVTETRTTPVTQRFISSGTTQILSADGKVNLPAPILDAPGGTTITGRDGVDLTEVHTTHTRVEDLRKEGNGITTKNKSIQHSSFEANSIGTNVIRGALLIQSKGDITIQGISVHDLRLETKGIARILLGTNTRSEQTVISGKSLIRQSTSLHQEHHQTFTQSHIQNLTVQSMETIVESIRGHTPAFLDNITQNGGALTQSFVDEVHQVTHVEHESLTPECMLVLGLGASIATWGMCSWMGGYLATSLGMTTPVMTTAGLVPTLTTAGSITAGMFTAGLSALTSQAIVTLANNDININKTLDDLRTSNTLKSVAITMSVAGLVGGGSLTNAPFVHHLTHHAIRMGAQMGAEAVINGRTDGKAAGLTAVAASLCGYFSNKIGHAYTKGDFGYFTHKFLHALSGGAGGAIIDGKKGAIAGAMGTAGVEVIADFLAPTGGKANDPNKPKLTDEEIKHIKDAARFSVVLVGLAAGLDAKQLSVEIALATVAVESNFEQSAKSLREGVNINDDNEKEEKETATQTLPGLTIDGQEFDVVDNVDNHPTQLKRSLSLTSLYLYEKIEQAKAEQNNTDGWWDKCTAGNKVERAKQKLAARPLNKVATQAKDYAENNPGKTAAYVSAALLSGGAAIAPTFATAAILGAAGGFTASMANHDFQIDSTQDIVNIGLSTLLGGLMPAPAKVFFPAAASVGAYGYYTDSPDLMWEGGLGAAFSFVPLVREMRFTTKNMTSTTAHFSASLDDSLLRTPSSFTKAPVTVNQASNVNNPIRQTNNFTSVNQFKQLSKGGQRAPVNQTPLTHNQTRATGTHGTPIPTHMTDATGHTYLGNQSRNNRFSETMSSGGNSTRPNVTPITRDGTTNLGNRSANPNTTPVNLGSTSNPHTTPITASAPKATTTPVPPKNTSKIPEYDSILFYGKTPGANGELIDVAVGIKGKKTHVLELKPKTTGLVEGAEEASAAAKKY